MPIDDDTIDESGSKLLVVHRVRREDEDVSFTVPEDSLDRYELRLPVDEVRESIPIQALLAEIGSRMGNADLDSKVGSFASAEPA